MLAWFAVYERDEKFEHHDATVAAISGLLAERLAMPLLSDDAVRAVRRLARERDLVPA